ncbi:ATP-dependent RNA helicase HrpA [Psittacicella hinzii]
MDEEQVAELYAQDARHSYGELQPSLGAAFARTFASNANPQSQKAKDHTDSFGQANQVEHADKDRHTNKANEQVVFKGSSHDHETFVAAETESTIGRESDFASQHYQSQHPQKQQHQQNLHNQQNSQPVRKHQNLRADETFGLSTVNPYADENGMYAAPRRISRLVPTAQTQSATTQANAVVHNANSSFTKEQVQEQVQAQGTNQTTTAAPSLTTLASDTALQANQEQFAQASSAASCYLARRQARLAGQSSSSQSTASAENTTSVASSEQTNNVVGKELGDTELVAKNLVASEITGEKFASTEVADEKFVGEEFASTNSQARAHLSAEQASKASNYHLLTAQDIQRIAQQDFQAESYDLAADKSPEARRQRAMQRYGNSYKDAAAFAAYRRYADDEDSALDLYQGVIAATEELFQEGHGDILVFLSGEREIRDVANELTHHYTHVNHRYPQLRILPLYSRLSSAEQQLIFKPDGNLRIILATNIAETSLTVPGIKYVIDAGTARISRYNYKTQVQGLPIEPISQASANQRKGRCGRTSPGICIRLYSEEDFANRPEFTDPEIKRTNLSAVILKMLSLNLPNIADFPFLDAPDNSYIRNGLKLLEQLQAIKVTPQGYAITKIGRQLADLPVDPRLGRMILEASNLGSLQEMLILAAGMTIVDVRETPQGKAAQAQQMHAEYRDKNSDFSTLLNLWNYLFQEKLSNTQFRKLCKKRYLNYLRVREWQDLYQQLKQIAMQLKLRFNQLPATYPEIHKAMIPGLLDHIAQIDSSDKMQYKGARGRVFKFFNTSALYKQRQHWVMVSELIHLNNTYAMRGAVIEPQWVEPYARHLLKYAYQQPHWSAKRGEVCAYMSANLFGLTIVDKRLVSYGKIDPAVSREIFIRQALVEQHWDQEYEFYIHNNTVLAQALKIEEQQRKRGIVISEEDLATWYSQRIPAHVRDNVSFAQWWEEKSRQEPHYLDIDYEHLLDKEQTLTSFPEYISDGNYQLKLNYLFEPESPWDGVNVLVPIQYLQALDYRLYQWHIANYRQELVETLIRNLPKNLRKQLIPAPDYARVFCQRIESVLMDKGKVLSFYQVLAHTFKQINGSLIEANAWQEAAANLPAHLTVHFKLLDLEGQVMAESNDLLQLQQDYARTSQELVNQKSKQDLAKAKIYTDFNFSEFGKMQQVKKGGVLLDSYPALMPILSLPNDKQKLLAPRLQNLQQELGNADLAQNHIAAGVIIQNLATADEQARVMHVGMRDLLLLNSHNPIKYLQEKLPNRAKLAMYFSGNVSQIIAECILAAADDIMQEYQAQAQAYAQGQEANRAKVQRQEDNINPQTMIWNQHYYQFMLDKMRANINDATYKVAQLVEQILVLANQVHKALKKQKDLELVFATNDMKQQVAALTRPDFVAEHSVSQLSQVPRYLEATLYRLERMGQNPALDQKRQEEVNEWEEVYQQLKANWPSYQDPAPLTELFFMLQELRVSLFAQTLGSRIPISSKRIAQYVEQLKQQVL